MTVFSIWAEGYACTGESSNAAFLGTEEAESFEKACDQLVAKSNIKELYKKQSDGVLTIWGCRLFDNEKDARRAFG
jgi:hypothetical protein